MRGLANPDSKIYGLINKFVLLLELNLLVVLGFLPVITIGATISAMHAVILKIYRNEEKRVFSDFFKAFKSNFKNGTILWLLLVFILVALVAGILLAMYYVPHLSFYVLLICVALGLGSILLITWALILQSRYVYSVGQSLKYGLLAWMKYPGSTFVYLIAIAIPIMLCYSVYVWPIVVCIGITLPQMMCAFLYSRVFDEMEGVPTQLPKL